MKIEYVKPNLSPEQEAAFVLLERDHLKRGVEDLKAEIERLRERVDFLEHINRQLYDELKRRVEGAK